MSTYTKSQAVDILKRYDALDEGAAFGLEPVKVKLDEFITSDPDLIEVKDTILKLSPATLPVLILGETGTGKELIAEALHGARKGEFLPVNCAGIPDTLLEAEFFGTVRGAYTGAVDKIGLIESAKDGTLFLDEIGDMPMLLQSKLLRVLQSKRFYRVGETKFRPVTCRLIAATNVSEEQLIKSKAFRPDLYYRLAGYTIKLKPLRERPPQDIVDIVNHYARNEDISAIIRYKLHTEYKSHIWPGNIRELINFVFAQNALLGGK